VASITVSPGARDSFAAIGDAPAEPLEFVAQYEDLELPAIGRAAKRDQELEDPAKSEAQKREHAPPPVGCQRRGKLTQQPRTVKV
jgi:hypothetical protein